VQAAYERGDAGVTGALRALKDVAERMVEALRGADLAQVGALLADNWHHQRALDPGMSTPEMGRLEAALAAAGALGGKAAGAGAGGCMFFLMPDDSGAGAAAARAAGAEVLPLRWAAQGVRTW
jgi:D-glycero-alpha-D-manno-heptose-7-phosphate kinase